MEAASLPCYLPPYSFQQTDNTYSAHAQRHQALVDCDYHALHRSSSSAQSPYLHFYVPAYRFLQPKRGLQLPRGGHTVVNMSPPAVTRCVSTMSSPFIGDCYRRQDASSSSSHDKCAAELVCSLSAGRAGGHDICSTHQNYVDTTMLNERRFLKWMDCGLLEYSDQNLPVLRSDHICRSLIDTSQRPSALNDAICMYIDYLTRDNESVIGDFSAVAGDRHLDTALTTIVNDQLYRDVFCQPSSFPTSRFREWLQIYSVDLEITDPEGRKLTEATFPGCGCQAHQAAYVNNCSVYQDSRSLSSQSTTESCSQSDLATSSITTVPRRPVLEAHQMYATQSREGRGRCARRPGRGRGPKRKSCWEYSDCAVSHHPALGQSHVITSDVPRWSLSSVDTQCNDDSAVVEFLASLQSDAVKRRSRQQELALQQLTSRVSSHDVNSHSQIKVIEEIVDDEFQLDESGMPHCHDHQQQVLASGTLNIPPQSSVNVSFKRQSTHEHLLPVSYPAVNDRCE